ncbi:putative OPT family oligopeptide transporter [Sphingomonas naasensis]|uniref:Oligopeptide transporter, OPT family n=1 Tax=Sphingomonas naasensis TaxID=1344951 RepID=A0A4V3QWG2_9SPHN|nr:oligopeptide transporter, OPT family [Sphingomonas naasensis]NIJ21829.1 putative OPT family oligopeptide transporter [Sphingomonas naasensis]TGX42472.1 oligopeptide transporter, OPT family [Sphingomonas naasensis]
MATAPRPLSELTLRGVVLGALITILFTAANVYAGLKVGLTFATSIPAAVVSMAILRAFKGANILENNIVQTIASAAGTLAAIVFVLPGLIMVGWWTGFPYWTTVAVCITGGVLGVMFSVPLRRALVTGSTLPYPEGVAAAEVLKVGTNSAEGDVENARGLRILILGSLFSGVFALLGKMKVVAEEAGKNFAIGNTATGFSTSWSMLLIGVGHLVGLSVGAAMFFGMLISWTTLVPYFAAGGDLSGGVDALVGGTFRGEVRFVGAGTIGVAAIWSLLKIIGPIVSGLRSALAASRARTAGETLELTERDLPIGIVALVTLLTLAPIAWLLWDFSAGGPVHDHPFAVIGGSLVYLLVVGVLIAAICGYMAGLIGASNSPVSGVGILAVLGASLLLVLIFGHEADPTRTNALIAYALFTTAIIFSIATISNDNLQDLKTGQLVGATPWKQQVALVLGVIFGSLAIPLVLDLLKDTLGFVGMPGAGPNALAAPQAALISSIAKGVLGGDIDWGLIGLGAVIGGVVIAIDEALGKAGRMRLPPLAVGMGIYLPMALTLLIPVGALIGHFYDRWAKRRPNAEFAERMGVLAATGLIVGESLFGVAFAGILAWANRNSPIPPNDAPLAVMGGSFEHIALWLAPFLFFGFIAIAYVTTRRLVRTAPPASEPPTDQEIANYR